MKTKPIQTAIITGDGSGMGRSSALALCGTGLQVFVADIDLAAAKETVQMAKGLNGKAKARQVNVSRSRSVAELLEGVMRDIEGSDYLVHTAAMLSETVLIQDLDDQVRTPPFIDPAGYGHLLICLY